VNGCLEFLFQGMELQRIGYTDEERSIEAIRGKGAESGSVTFQWTKGVKALIRLAAGTYIDSNYRDTDKTLYQAMLNKKSWYAELFGHHRICTMVDGKIKLGACELVFQNNSGDPLERESIVEIWRMVSELGAVTDSVNEDGYKVEDWLFNSIKSELEFGLFFTNVFDKVRLHSGLNSLANTELFNRICQYRSLSPLVAFAEQFSSMDLRALNYLRLVRPIKIGVGPGAVAFDAIARQARKMGNPIELCNNAPCSQYFLQDDGHGYDGFVLDISTYARLYSKSSSYQPLCFLPATSNGNVIPQGCDQKFGDVATLEEISSTSFYLEEQGTLNSARIANIGDSISFDETTCATFWPFTDIFGHAIGAAVTRGYRWEYDVAILMVHNSVFRDRQVASSLFLAIRDAWMVLREHAGIMNQRLEEIVSDKPLISNILRTSGYHCLVSRNRMNNGTREALS
jgi:hypothetical protein